MQSSAGRLGPHYQETPTCEQVGVKYAHKCIHKCRVSLSIPTRDPALDPYLWVTLYESRSRAQSVYGTPLQIPACGVLL